MLQRRYRLTNNADFKNVFRHGKAIPSKYVVMYFRPSSDNKLRIGFSVSKKIGGSVVRSRVKRVLREAIRKHVEQLKNGFDVVLIARSSIKGIKSTQVEQSLVRLFEKNGLFKR